ncbi:hypothetical protein PCE1_002286 [Barthelona sp. PCE]
MESFKCDFPVIKLSNGHPNRVPKKLFSYYSPLIIPKKMPLFAQNERFRYLKTIFKLQKNDTPTIFKKVSKKSNHKLLPILQSILNVPVIHQKVGVYQEKPENSSCFVPNIHRWRKRMKGICVSPLNTIRKPLTDMFSVSQCFTIARAKIKRIKRFRCPEYKFTTYYSRNREQRASLPSCDLRIDINHVSPRKTAREPFFAHEIKIIQKKLESPLQHDVPQTPTPLTSYTHMNASEIVHPVSEQTTDVSTAFDIEIAEFVMQLQNTSLLSVEEKRVKFMHLSTTAPRILPTPNLPCMDKQSGEIVILEPGYSMFSYVYSRNAHVISDFKHATAVNAIIKTPNTNIVLYPNDIRSALQQPNLVISVNQFRDNISYILGCGKPIVFVSGASAIPTLVTLRYNTGPAYQRMAKLIRSWNSVLERSQASFSNSKSVQNMTALLEVIKRIQHQYIMCGPETALIVIQTMYNKMLRTSLQLKQILNMLKDERTSLPLLLKEMGQKINGRVRVRAQTAAQASFLMGKGIQASHDRLTDNRAGDYSAIVWINEIDPIELLLFIDRPHCLAIVEITTVCNQLNLELEPNPSLTDSKNGAVRTFRTFNEMQTSFRRLSELSKTNQLTTELVQISFKKRLSNSNEFEPPLKENRPSTPKSSLLSFSTIDLGMNRLHQYGMFGNNQAPYTTLPNQVYHTSPMAINTSPY